MGFLSLNVTPPGGTGFSVSTKTYQFGGGINYRYIFMKDEERSPYARARFGYAILTFSPGAQPSPVLSKNKYSDLMIGIGVDFPFWFVENPRLGIKFNFDYFIISKLSESVVNNGTTNSSKGFQFSMGPYWYFYKGIFTSIDLNYMKHSVNFGAPDTTLGSRADVADGAKSSDSYLGVLIGFGVTF